MCWPHGGAENRARHTVGGKSPHGKQTCANSSCAHGTSTNSHGAIRGCQKSFDRVARKWNVDYAFYKTGPDKYLLFFKAGQADAMTACFSEYSRKVLSKVKIEPQFPSGNRLQAGRQISFPEKSRNRKNVQRRWPMRTDKIRKYLIPNIPVSVHPAGRSSSWERPTGWRRVTILHISSSGWARRLARPLLTLHPVLAPLDWLVGIVGAVGFRLLIYFKSKNAKKFRRDAEYGSGPVGNGKRHQTVCRSEV